ncbi:Isotrichodermin C-15 hydroxylase [Cytospora mali]|uniref:Isotrichodermin C-15 hydroxylase n=1 Tax=Cytospora mali TaxID=578113 RepID=A0A194VU93_CYTMA|nr:Isotrichodermin C-15 hydroxylase [Valsa mali]
MMISLTIPSNLQALPPSFTDITLKQWILLAGGIFIIHTLISYVYNAYLHPLSKYPGPKLASISDLWTSYFLCAGRWPWVVESTLGKYGDIIRIGPNSLVFLEPQAFNDTHGPKRDLKDTFVKTPIVDGLGDEDDGLLWERNPEKHRRVSKMMSPVFSGNSLRAKVPTMNKYIDLMMTSIKEHGTRVEGINLTTWLNWLCMDVAVDLSCSWELHQVRDMKNHRFLDAMEAANTLVVILATAKTYPILTPLALLFVPWNVMRSLPRMISELRVHIIERIEARDNLKHSDYFEQLLPSNKPAPKSTKQMRHMLTVAGQLILGGYDPTSVTIYMMFFFILQNPEALEQLEHEIRETFSGYEDIEAESLRTMPWLNACLQETLRLSSAATHHSLPRISPGGIVNGEYIPKGVLCRSSLFAYSRSARFFHDPRSFRPERWLQQDHPRYDPAFAKDDHSAHFPFITGPRQCPGREVARIMFRLVVAKMLWLFDVEQVSKELDFDRDFRVYGMWTKPDLRVRLVPVQRG